MLERSLQIGRIAKTDIHIHWSFLLGCAAVYMFLPISFVLATILIVSLFLSIFLHELGHILVAQRLGYQTRYMIFWMLGGVVFFHREPYRARDTILVALFGPLVNIAIAGVVAGLGWILSIIQPNWSQVLAESLSVLNLPRLNSESIGRMIFSINIALALFNLLPVYPLDGGRIFRAGLTRYIGVRRADQVALILGLIVVGALLIFFAIEGAWLSFGEALLLLLVVSTLNPWFNRSFSRGVSWLSNRGLYYTYYAQDYEQALAYIHRQEARGPLSAEHYILQSYILLKVGDLSAAWKAADQAVGLCPLPDQKRAMALNNRGAISHLLGDTDTARADLDQAIMANPNLVHAYTSRGQLAAQLGDNDSALQDLNMAIEITPDFSEARYCRAALRFQCGDLEGARTDAAYLFADDRNDMPDWSDRELQFTLTNQVAWAQQIATWADTYDWSSVRALRFLGDTLWVNEQFADAVSVYTQALAVAPKNATLLLRRAIAQQACGAIDAARADFTSVLANRPTPYIRQRAVVLLAALTPTTTHMDSESEPFSSADRVGEEVLG